MNSDIFILEVIEMLQAIDILFFEVIKQQTKKLFEPVRGDELRITVSHRLI